jgi:heterodisulfide reductase subunit C/nitrate reductase gamma subunit
MTLEFFLICSLIIFFFGLVRKISLWFTLKVHTSHRNITPSQRVKSAAKGILETIFSKKILILLRVFVLDVLVQKRIFQESLVRWLMHMLIYGGFMLLLLMHALGSVITISLFEDYASTLNPFFFLRDFFALMVVAGLVIALWRRFVHPVPRLKTTGMDRYAIILLAVIMVSGVFLEGAKITSYGAFQQMVEDYADTDVEAELRTLESLWVNDFGLVSPNVTAPFEDDTLEAGRDLHEMSCVGCHASSKWAFMGFGTSKALRPMALFLDRTGAPLVLWYIHILACFIGLAYLPFSKMFHIIASPISLLAGAVMDRDQSDPANIATRQVMELDACMHCCTCSLRCSAAVAYDTKGNDYILPGEKIGVLKKLVRGGKLGKKEIHAIQEGIYLCTNCERCTVVCPAGIVLRDLWFDMREDLLQRDIPVLATLSPYSFFRGLSRPKIDKSLYGRPLVEARKAVAVDFDTWVNKESPLPLGGVVSQPAGQGGDGTFAACFSCRSCTTVCPVVKGLEDPEAKLDLLPHQIMCCLGLGLDDMAMGPRMLWDCVTCYQCQEHCPQQVRVADLLYALRNRAIQKAARFSPGAEEV